MLCRTSGRRWRQLNRQLIQVYRRYQTAALSIQQHQKKIQKKLSIPTDFTMTGLVRSAAWFSQILWLNNSVSHVLSALKALSQVSRAYPLDKGYFSLIQLCFSFFAAFSCSSNPSPCQLSHPPFSAHLLGLSFLFFPPAPSLAQGPYS